MVPDCPAGARRELSEQSVEDVCSRTTGVLPSAAKPILKIPDEPQAATTCAPLFTEAVATFKAEAQEVLDVIGVAWKSRERMNRTTPLLSHATYTPEPSADRVTARAFGHCAAVATRRACDVATAMATTPTGPLAMNRTSVEASYARHCGVVHVIVSDSLVGTPPTTNNTVAVD